MKKLKFPVKIAPILINVDKIDSNYIIHTIDQNTKEKIPIISVIKEKNNPNLIKIIHELDNINYELRIPENDNSNNNNSIIVNIIVIPYKNRNGEEMYIEEPFIVQTKDPTANMFNVDCLTPFEITYSDYSNEEENLIVNSCIQTSRFKVNITTLKNFDSIEVSKVKLDVDDVLFFGIYGSEYLVITTNRIYSGCLLESNSWLFNYIKKFGAKKINTDYYYKIEITYSMETLFGEIIEIQHCFDYIEGLKYENDSDRYTLNIEDLTMEILIFDENEMELAAYTRYVNRETELTKEEIKIIEDIKEFRKFLKENLEPDTKLAAEYIHKREFIEKYSERLYNTFIELVKNISPPRPGTILNIINSLEVTRLLEDIEKGKIEEVTCNFIVYKEAPDMLYRLRYNKELTEESPEALLLVEINKPNEEMIKENTVIKFYKDDFEFFKALSSLSVCVDLRDLI